MDLLTRVSLASHNRLNYEIYKLQEAINPVQSLRIMSKTVLTSAIFMNATLRVDNIYALYSMLVMYGLPLPAPDYNKAFEVVYEETVWAWIQQWQDLSILQTAARPGQIQNLPSWVPAYHLPIDLIWELPAFKDYSWGHITFEDNPYAGYAKARHIPKMLKVKGRYIGKVTRGCHNFSWDFKTIGEILCWADLCKHLSDESSWESLGYDGMLRELFETLAFPRRSEYINEDNFSMFRSWFGYRFGEDHTEFRREGSEEQNWIEEFEVKVFPCSLCMLDNGMLGKANGWCRVGDELFLLRGADCPFVLQRDGDNYSLVGPAYVHRVHQTQPWRFDGDDVRDITLV